MKTQTIRAYLKELFPDAKYSTIDEFLISEREDKFSIVLSEKRKEVLVNKFKARSNK